METTKNTHNCQRQVPNSLERLLAGRKIEARKQIKEEVISSTRKIMQEMAVC